MEPEEEEAATPVQDINPLLVEAWETVQRELPELEEVDNARMGMMPDKQYVFQAGDAGPNNPIYKRKYEVLGMTLNQQQNYMRQFNRAVRKGRELESVKKLCEMMKKGAGGMDKKAIRAESQKLQTGNRLATLFFNDVMPEIMDDPVANTLGGLFATAAIVVATLLICLCFFPPIMLPES